LKARGVTIIYVSHRMPEVFRLCDRISVLRDGKYVGTLDRAAATEDEVVRMMIGRSVEAYLPQHHDAIRGEVLLSVRNLSSAGKFRDVSFDVRAGEIVGFAGLVGAGRSEVARAIFGLDPRARGEVVLDGRPLPTGRVRAAIRRGIGLVPEDRKRQGLVLNMGSRQNFSMAMLDRLRRLFILDRRRERRQAADYFAKLRVQTPSLDTAVAALSGGNQQKVALARWLARGSRVLIVDEPTRGVDVGAKAATHQFLDQFARQGVAIVLISSELPQVLALSSRILVLRAGRLVGEVPQAQATQERVVRLMAGIAAAT
jgi:ABC-type sugar transport system ATPase subunit